MKACSCCHIRKDMRFRSQSRTRELSEVDIPRAANSKLYVNIFFQYVAKMFDG